MALTFGFYNSLNHDRKYNAEQFGSIFDGVINDGVYSNIGGKLMVKTANNGMQVNIQTGRAWFNHTWTLNDTIYPIELPTAEPLLSKYVAVVLEVNKEEAIRTNSFKVISGTPASNPTKPTLINSGEVHQYALAYVLIKPAVTVIKQADIINNVGKTGCPFVTAVNVSMTIDDLIARWEDQWNRWMTYVENQWNSFDSRFESWFSASQTEWNTFVNAKTDEFANFLTAQYTRVDEFITAKDTELDEVVDDFSEQLNTLFSDVEAEAQQYFDDSSAAWTAWFQHYQDELSSSQAAHLQAQIDAISFIYVIDETLFLPNTGASVQNERITLTIGNNS